jgi:AraC family transcriptional regulator of arabinose operon
MSNPRIDFTLESSEQLDSRRLITDPRVRTVMALMEGNLAKRFSISNLAKTVNLSTWRLCHLFSDQTGMAPAHYFRALRMQQATLLLETTFMSVKEIMFSVGINDYSHFVRDFKTYHGVTPSNFRRRFLSKGALSLDQQKPLLNGRIGQKKWVD